MYLEILPITGRTAAATGSPRYAAATSRAHALKTADLPAGRVRAREGVSIQEIMRIGDI